jgi:hypothetical protein
VRTSCLDLRLLVHDVNNAAERQVTEGTLDRLFDATWQELKDSIDEAIDGAATAQATSKRKTDDMLVEVVETVRRIERYRDGDMKRAIEKELRLSEFSYTLGPQGGRRSTRPNQTLAASKAGPVPPDGPDIEELTSGSSQDEDQQP